MVLVLALQLLCSVARPHRFIAHSARLLLRAPSDIGGHALYVLRREALADAAEFLTERQELLVAHHVGVDDLLALLDGPLDEQLLLPVLVPREGLRSASVPLRPLLLLLLELQGDLEREGVLLAVGCQLDGLLDSLLVLVQLPLEVRVLGFEEVPLSCYALELLLFLAQLQLQLHDLPVKVNHH